MRYAVLVASIAVQGCLGGIYAWSAFVPGLIANYGLSTAQTQLVFGLLFTFFTVTMVFAGKVLERRGPRWLLISSGLLFFAGYLVAALSGGRFSLMLLGISVLAGAATGIGYVCPISTCVKWFPRQKGLVTGVAVAGFGAGAIVLASVAEAMLESGISVLAIFGWIGLVYGGVILVSGLVMRFPVTPPRHCRRPALPLRQLTSDNFFWALFSGLFCGTFAGLIVIGNLDPLAQANGVSARMAVLGISTFAVGNGIGRIVWGRITDHLSRRAVVPSLLTLAAAIAILLPATVNAFLFVVAASFAGFGFGACFVVYAALTANRYGAHHVGNVYPLVFLAYGVAGITGPMLGGWLRDATGGYGASALLAVAVLAIGMAVSGLLLRSAKEAPAVLDQERWSA